jgi:methionyl-tRNA formyltransferase
MNIIFFGSFQHYSTLILQALIDSPDITVTGVVTTPPMPVGRKQIITKTPVHLLADHHTIPVFIPISLKNGQGDQNVHPTNAVSHQPLDEADTGTTVLQSIPQPDFFITAGYGKILPKTWLNYPTHGSLNLHFSLLPAYRGANPAEWAIMCGENQTGITFMKMSQKLDGGDIIEKRELPISAADTRETLYQKLYALGAKELPGMLLRYHKRQKIDQFDCQQSLAPKSQPKQSPTPYAALLKRQDGFIPWATIQKYLKKQALHITDFSSKHLQTACLYAQSDTVNFLLRLPRALATYPSLWTIIPTPKGDKRMKILDFQPFTVQIEGKQPALFNQVKNLIK